MLNFFAMIFVLFVILSIIIIELAVLILMLIPIIWSHIFLVLSWSIFIVFSGPFLFFVLVMLSTFVFSWRRWWWPEWIFITTKILMSWMMWWWWCWPEWVFITNNILKRHFISFGNSLEVSLKLNR